MKMNNRFTLLMQTSVSIYWIGCIVLHSAETIQLYIVDMTVYSKI